MAVAQGVEGRPLIGKEGAQLALYNIQAFYREGDTDCSVSHSMV